MTTMPRTLVVEPRPIGHRAFYLSLIMRAMEGDAVSMLAPPADPSILAHFKRRGLDPAAHDFIEPEGIGASAVISQAATLCRERHFKRVFFAYLDEFLPHLVTRVPPFPVPVSGIWFHPHALDLRYRWLPPLDKRLRQRRTIHRALRHPTAGHGLGHLYFLDPAALNAVARLDPSISATLLPDPWEKSAVMDQTTARLRFGLPDDRMIFLHIGSSEKRKGLGDVITAFESLRPVASGKRPLLLRVGENDRLKPADRARLASLEHKRMAMVVEGFVSEADFIEYFAAADWILMPYRGFRYSSGILSNSIGTGKPVIAADYGMISQVVRESGLGLLFRHRSAGDLASKIRIATDSEIPAISPNLREKHAPGRFVIAFQRHFSR